MRALTMLLWLGALGACSRDDGDDDDDRAGEGEGEGEPGEGEGEADGCAGGLLDKMTGTLLAHGGAPIAGATSGVCLRADQGAFETFVCLRPVETDETGAWAVSIPERLRCVLHATLRLAAPGHATSYCVVPVEGAEGSIAAPAHELVPMPVESPVWNGEQPIDLVADDGATVTIRPSDLDDAQDPAAVRFRRVDLSEHRPCFLPEGHDVLALYVLEPEAPVTREEGLSALLPAPSGATAGTPLSLHLLGGLHTTLDGELVQEGSWVPFETAAVQADTVPAHLPQLGWFGLVRD